MEKRCIIACKVLWREIYYFTARSPHYYNVIFLEQGLHNEPGKLNEQLQLKINEIEGEYPTILIGYGLCSNGIVGIKSNKADLVFMRGHDCITFFLGSMEIYRNHFDSFPGTYWYNTGWIETSGIPNKAFYDQKFLEYADKYDEETAEYLVESEKEWLTKYNTISYIHQGLTDEDKYREMASDAAGYLNWNYNELKGDLTLIKDWILGEWDDSRFLVVHPGQVAEASFDETIVKVSKLS